MGTVLLGLIHLKTSQAAWQCPPAQGHLPLASCSPCWAHPVPVLVPVPQLCQRWGLLPLLLLGGEGLRPHRARGHLCARYRGQLQLGEGNSLHSGLGWKGFPVSVVGKLQQLQGLWGGRVVVVAQSVGWVWIHFEIRELLCLIKILINTRI